MDYNIDPFVFFDVCAESFTIIVELVCLLFKLWARLVLKNT